MLEKKKKMENEDCFGRDYLECYFSCIDCIVKNSCKRVFNINIKEVNKSVRKNKKKS